MQYISYCANIAGIAEDADPMRDDGSPVDQVLQAVQEAYVGLLWSVPLVLAGIVLTGSAFYFAFVRPQTRGRGWKAWLGYLFPRDMYTTRSAKVDINVWLLNGLIFIPVFEACVIITGLVAGVSFNELFAGWFGPAATLTSQVWLIVAIQFLGFWFGQGIGQYSGHLAMHKVPVLWALHRGHHSAESANLFTFLRSHPLEHFINGATRVIGTAAGLGIALYITGSQLLPETTATIFWCNVAYVLIGFRSVDHLHIPVSYGAFSTCLSAPRSCTKSITAPRRSIATSTWLARAICSTGRSERFMFRRERRAGVGASMTRSWARPIRTTR
jgi:sterol desaturase/sphingolipid hydroxylase (fatty acid hydroxylase superfamily)